MDKEMEKLILNNAKYYAENKTEIMLHDVV